MRHTLLAILALLCGTSAGAEVPVPNSIDDALKIAEQALQGDSRVSSTKVDWVNKSLVLTTTSGEERTLNPDNLYLSLKAAVSERDRVAIIQEYVEAIFATAVPDAARAIIRKENILPVLRPTDMLTAYDFESPLASRSFAGDISIVFVFDSELSMR